MSRKKYRPWQPSQPYLEPMVRRLQRNLGSVPETVTADAGYWSAAGVEAVEAMGSKALVAVSRGRKTERTPPGATGPPSEDLTPKRPPEGGPLRPNDRLVRMPAATRYGLQGHGAPP